jgi:hypothetical protein
MAFRISPERKAEINARAKAAGMSTTAYMIAASLGELHVLSRIDALEVRIEQLETARRRRK